MGRPEKTITTGVAELAALAGHLRAARADAGKTYPELEREGGYSASVFSRAASGDALPTWPVARAYGAACGADDRDLLALWEAARSALARHRSEATDGDGAPAGPTDFNLRLRELIRRRGTQRAVAERANCSPSTVSAALNASRVPTAEFLDRIMESLRLEPAERERWCDWRAALDRPEPDPARSAYLPATPAADPAVPPGRPAAPAARVAPDGQATVSAAPGSEVTASAPPGGVVPAVLSGVAGPPGTDPGRGFGAGAVRGPVHRPARGLAPVAVRDPAEPPLAALLPLLLAALVIAGLLALLPTLLARIIPTC